jgi:hypothetical protein
MLIKVGIKSVKSKLTAASICSGVTTTPIPQNSANLAKAGFSSGFERKYSNAAKRFSNV